MKQLLFEWMCVCIPHPLLTNRCNVLNNVAGLSVVTFTEYIQALQSGEAFWICWFQRLHNDLVQSVHHAGRNGAWWIMQSARAAKRFAIFSHTNITVWLRQLRAYMHNFCVTLFGNERLLDWFWVTESHRSCCGGLCKSGSRLSDWISPSL